MNNDQLKQTLDQKRAALCVLKRTVKRRYASKYSWADVSIKAAIKSTEAEIFDLRRQLRNNLSSL